MATPAAILSLLVKTEGAQSAAAQLDRLEGAARKTTRAADTTSAAFVKTGRTAKHHAEEAVAANVALTGSFTRMARAAVTAGAGFAAAYVGISKAKDAITQTAELAHNTEVLHRNTGLYIKTASGLEAVLKSRKIDASSVNMAFQTLARNLISAETGTKRSQAAFMSLGISMGDLKRAHGDLNVLLPKVADGFGQMKGGADRLAVSQALLGRGYRSLLPLFNEGSAGLQQQIQLADKYGATLDGKALQQVMRLVQAQRQLSLASTGLKIAFTEAATPALLAMSGLAEKVARDFHGPGSLDEKLSRVGRDVGPALTRLEHVFEAAIPKIANHVGRDAPKVAMAFVRGFGQADVWGKLALGAFLVKAMGGWKSIFALFGARDAAAYTVSFESKAAGGLAASTAAGGVVGTAVSKESRWRSLGLIAGRAFGVMAAIEITAQISKAIEVKLPHWLSGLNFGGMVDPIGQLANLVTGSGSHGGVGRVNNKIGDILKGLSGGQKRYVNVARQAAITAGVDPNTFIRQIRQESGFNPNANSGKARGIAQLTPGTARSLHVNPFDPDASLQAAAKLMARYLRQYNNNIAKALIAYNAGPGDVNLPFRSLPKETQGYLTSILGKGAPGMLTRGTTPKSFTDYLNQLNKKKGPKGTPAPADLVWAQSMIGHFKETMGQNRGPELDRLQKEFGTTAAAWCAEFATKALVQSGFPKGVKTASVATLNAFAKAGNFGLHFTTSPKPGDLMTFGSRHVGIVEKVNRHTGTVQTIAGNTGKGEVSRSTYKLGAGRYISVNAAGAATHPYHMPSFHVPKITQQDMLDFVNQRLNHFDLMVQAGLMTALQAAAAKRKFLTSQLKIGAFQGDTKLEVMGLLRQLGVNLTPAQKTWTPQAKRSLAMAIIQANPGNVANLPAGVFKAAGDYATMQNPWMKAYQQNLTNQVGAGVLTQTQSDAALATVLQKSLPFLKGQDLADAVTTLHTIATNTAEAARAALDTANAVRESGVSDAQFLGGLTGAGADAVRGILSSYGINELPGGGSISEIGNTAAASALASSDIGTLMGEVAAGQMDFSDVWPQIVNDLGVIASGAEASAEASSAATDAVNALTDEIKKNNDFAQSVTATELGQYMRALADFVNGQIYGNYNNRSSTASAGAVARY